MFCITNIPEWYLMVGSRQFYLCCSFTTHVQESSITHSWFLKITIMVLVMVSFISNYFFKNHFWGIGFSAGWKSWNSWKKDNFQKLGWNSWKIIQILSQKAGKSGQTFLSICKCWILELLIFQNCIRTKFLVHSLNLTCLRKILKSSQM